MKKEKFLLDLEEMFLPIINSLNYEGNEMKHNLKFAFILSYVSMCITV